MDINYITVDGVNLPSPTSITVNTNDLDSENTKRAEGTGVMVRERIRAGVYQLSYGWEQLTDAELTTIVNAISPEEVNVKFWYGGYKQAKMYAAEGKAEMTSSPKGEPRWSYSCSFTEY